MEPNNFGFSDNETQEFMFDTMVSSFIPLLNDQAVVLETNSGRGDFKKYLEEKLYNIKSFYNHDLRYIFKNDNSFVGSLNSINIIEDIDIIFHNFTLQNSVPLLLIDEDLNEFDLFRYLVSEWDLLSENNVRYSLFTLALNTEKDRELLHKIINFCISMDIKLGVDYHPSHKLVNIIIFH